MIIKIVTNMKKILSILALVFVAMTARAEGDFQLTVGTNAHGTITFKVDDNVVNVAQEGQTVTVIVTPNTGWTTKAVSGKWFAAVAKTRGVDMLNNITLTAAGTNTYTFTMQRANVEINATYKQLIQTSWITLGTSEYTYNAQANEPTVTVKNGDVTIPASAYSVSYTNNVNAAAATATEAPTVTVTINSSNDDYAGTASKAFTINPAELTQLTLKETLLTHAFKELTVEAASVKAGELDVPESGYTLSGNKGTDVGNYTAKATGIGNFTGTATATWRIKEGEPKIDVDANETGEENKEVDDVKMKMSITDDAAENTTTETRTVTDPETGAEKQETYTVIPVVLDDITVPEQAGEKKEITVTVPSEIVDGNVIYKVTEIKADAFKTDANSNTVVTAVILPETDTPIEIADGAMKVEDQLLNVITPLSMLDDYALMTSLKDNYESSLITATATPKNKYWTFSSGVDCTLPEGINAFIATYNGGKIRIVPLSEDDLKLADNRRGIKANNGVLLACTSDKGGDAYTFTASPGRQLSGATIAQEDANSYTGNCLVPVIEGMHFDSNNYMILKDNEFYEIDPSINTKVPACKAVLNKAKGK